jgi:hypothetical protein
MGALIGGIVMLAISLWIAVDRVRARRQTVDQAIDVVLKQLAFERTSNGNALVTIWQAYPLSETMIIDVAETRGFRYELERGTYNGSRALAFSRSKDITQRLSLNVD